MNATIITIGDEILAGNTVDTNSNFIAGELKKIGIKVKQIFTISDEIETIKEYLSLAFKSADLIITTGGLGPTRDDKTKKAIADFFSDELVLDEATFSHLKTYLEKKGRTEILDRNRDQALVPQSATVFQNHHGTAPCMMMMKENKILFSLPGVPYEAKPLISDQIIPFLKNKFALPYIISRFVSVVGIPESILADKIEQWELSLPENFALSYLPIGTRVKLKLTAFGEVEKTLQLQLQEQIELLDPIIGTHIIATFEEKIEKILGELLVSKNSTLSTAESCTGGTIAKLILNNSGASAYYKGGVIPYETAQKVKILGVNEETIKSHTVVSQKVSEEMALGCQALFATEVAIASTGVAGPSLGEDGHEVGVVFYSIVYKKNMLSKKLFVPHLQREDFMYFTSQKIIQDAVEFIINNDVQ